MDFFQFADSQGVCQRARRKPNPEARKASTPPVSLTLRCVEGQADGGIPLDEHVQRTFAHTDRSSDD